MTTLTCHELIDFLSDFLDGRLPAESEKLFQAHLLICPDCVAYLDNFRATLQAGKAAFADAATTEPPPEELVQAILASRK